MLFSKEKFLLIAGPCVIENKTVATQVAEKLKEIEGKFPELTIVFKGSFDKANRSSVHGKRGPGIHSGLEILQHIKESFHFPVLTDIHSPEQAAIAAEVCDVLQIPAFLCRQTDLLMAAAQTGRTVNVKKGQFLSPEEMRFIVEKLENNNAKEIWQTERGTCFGYHRFVVDMRTFQIMKSHNHPAIFDATHSVQLPGAGRNQSGGEREFVPALARAAIAAGAQGLFLETHPDPKNASSDRETQLPLADLEPLMRSCIAIWKAVRTP
jgi:2-dehydro-3-deoxyphosphooctonate aldolase (KDO 8-P synthase)